MSALARRWPQCVRSFPVRFAGGCKITCGKILSFCLVKLMKLRLRYNIRYNRDPSLRPFGNLADRCGFDVSEPLRQRRQLWVSNVPDFASYVKQNWEGQCQKDQKTVWFFGMYTIWSLLWILLSKFQRCVPKWACHCAVGFSLFFAPKKHRIVENVLKFHFFSQAFHLFQHFFNEHLCRRTAQHSATCFHMSSYSCNSLQYKIPNDNVRGC